MKNIKRLALIGTLGLTSVVGGAIGADKVEALGSCTLVNAQYNVSGRCDTAGGSPFVYAYTECWTYSGYHAIWDHTAAGVGQVTTVYCSTGIHRNSRLVQTYNPTP